VISATDLRPTSWPPSGDGAEVRRCAMRGCVPTRGGGSSVRARSAISNYLRIAFGARGCIRVSQDARKGWKRISYARKSFIHRRARQPLRFHHCQSLTRLWILSRLMQERGDLPFRRVGAYVRQNHFSDLFSRWFAARQQRIGPEMLRGRGNIISPEATDQSVARSRVTGSVLL
jgi:hypothetical protein